jgi:hypothetical protein
MNRTISTAIIALALGLSAPAFAQETSTDSQLPEGLSDSLTQYGYEVDPSLLTEQQRERFTELGVVNSGSDDEEEMRSRIDEILVMDAGTATYVSQEMRAMMDNPTELQANAESLFSKFGMTDVDVSGLTTEQLAQLWFLQERGEESSDDDVRLRIEEILGQS